MSTFLWLTRERLLSGLHAQPSALHLPAETKLGDSASAESPLHVEAALPSSCFADTHAVRLQSCGVRKIRIADVEGGIDWDVHIVTGQTSAPTATRLAQKVVELARAGHRRSLISALLGQSLEVVEMALAEAKAQAPLSRVIDEPSVNRSVIQPMIDRSVGSITTVIA